MTKESIIRAVYYAQQNMRRTNLFVRFHNYVFHEFGFCSCWNTCSKWILHWRVHLISISSDIICTETFDIEFHRLFSGPVIPWLDTSGLAVDLFGFAETCSTYLSIMRVTVNGSQLLQLVPSLLYSSLQYI